MATMEDIGSQMRLHHDPLAGPDREGFLRWHTLPHELKIRIMRTFVPSSVSCTKYDASRTGPLQRPDGEPWASRRALATACLASSQLKGICTPLLFEVVALRSHREVMCFLRSLMGNHELRARVRQLACVRLARADETNRRTSEAGPRPEGLVVEDPSSWFITSSDRALVEMFQLELRANGTTNGFVDSTQKALAVILAMLPRIEVLFLTHEPNGTGFLDRSSSTTQHPVTRLLSPSLQSLSTLEEIIVEFPWDGWKMWFLILNCPRLRRVVLKGHVAFDASLGLTEWKNNHLDTAEAETQRPPILHEVQLLSRATVGKIQELYLFKSRQVTWVLLPMIFPHLERLVTVFGENKWRDAYWSATWDRGQPVRLPVALGQVITLYKDSLRSLTVTDFLSDNEWTSFFFHVAPIPPLLSPGLPQVPLVDLTTDCVWLFGRDDSAISHQISSLLPSSLVSLHLIDYWARSVSEEGARIFYPPQTGVDQGPGGPGGRLKTIDYYPAFPSGLSPLEFLGEVFATLHDSCADQHTQLKQITLSSPLFDDTGRWSRTAGRPIDRAEVQAWQARVANDFAKIGVRFSFTTMMELEKSIESSWACI